MLNIANALSEAPSIINDPFKSSKMNLLYIHCMKSTFNDTFNITGQVQFVNGDTEGTQKFKAATLGEFLQQMEAFIKSLDS